MLGFEKWYCVQTKNMLAPIDWISSYVEIYRLLRSHLFLKNLILELIISLLSCLGNPISVNYQYLGFVWTGNIALESSKVVRMAIN